jgi:hypothetical protein
MASAQALDAFEHGRQRGDAFTVLRCLVLEVAGVAAGWVDPSDIERGNLFQVQLVEGFAARLQPSSAGVARDVGVGRGVVRDHRHALGTEHHVELEGGHADGQGLLEGGQRVFRRKAPGTPVTLRVKGQRSAGAPHRQTQRGGATPAQP